MLLWISLLAGAAGIALGSRARIYLCATLNGMSGAGAYLYLWLWGMHLFWCASLRRDEKGRLYCVLQNGKKKQKKPRRSTRFNKTLPRRLLAAAHLDHMRVCTWEGCGDAAATAVVKGLLQAALGCGVCYLLQRDPKAKIQLEVLPCYEQTRFKMQVYGIAHMHVGHAIAAVIRAAFAGKKRGSIDGAGN